MVAAAPARHSESPSVCGGRLIPEDFCERVVESYVHGCESQLPADEHAARSLMPPATALHRSFRHLAPEIPRFHAEACVGCMECVNECPDTAILARVAEPQILDA
jgi:NAD-dependent dihydropyrimidine dehydrogenase PreA subunit